MKNINIIFRCIIIILCLPAFTTCSMEGWISVSPDSKFFDHELQGTWQTNGISDYSGTLVITTNSIRISGYAPNSLYELTHGINHRPFRNFVKDTALEGYSEESKIFIKDGGNWQDGIPYTYWDSYPPPDFRRIQFLRFQFGGRFETLQKIN